MNREEMDKHIRFLNDYARQHQIVFKVTRYSVTVESLITEKIEQARPEQ